MTTLIEIKEDEYYNLDRFEFIRVESLGGRYYIMAFSPEIQLFQTDSLEWAQITLKYIVDLWAIGGVVITQSQLKRDKTM